MIKSIATSNYVTSKKKCPKNEFALLNIDILVDAIVAHLRFSFIDGVSGYNQIKMHAH